MFSILICLLPGMCIGAAAQDATALLVNSDPASLSMGRSSGHANTAMLVHPDYRLDVSLSYGIWAPSGADNNLLGIDAAYKFSDRIAVSFNGEYLADRIPSIVTGSDGAPSGEIYPKNFIADIGAAFLVTPQLSLGVDAKMLMTSLSGEGGASVYAADISAAYSGDSYYAGLSACNLGAVTSLVRAEGGYSVGGLMVEAEADYLFKGSFMASAGLEYGFKDLAFVRAGYHYGSGDIAVPSFASIGLGVKFAGISFDAAFLLASETLGGTMLFRAGYRF